MHRTSTHISEIVRQLLETGPKTFDQLWDAYRKRTGASSRGQRTNLLYYLAEARDKGWVGQEGGRYVNPRGRAAKRRKLSSGMDLVWRLLDKKTMLGVRSALREDRQSAELLLKIFTELAERLEPMENTINRLSNIRPDSDLANLRNQVFKAADTLGIRLPSGVF